MSGKTPLQKNVQRVWRAWDRDDAYLCRNPSHWFGFLACLFIQMIIAITYSENEVLCKDTVGSHSSSTVSREGYFWNIIRGGGETALTERSVFACIQHRQQKNIILLWNKNNLPFASTHLIAWPGEKRAPAAGCFCRFASRREQRRRLPQQEWKSLGHSEGSLYSPDSHLFGGVSQQSAQCQLHIPLEFSYTHLRWWSYC